MTPRLPPVNLARACLGPAPHRPADGLGLVVTHDLDDPSAGEERWTWGELADAVRAVAAGLLGSGIRPGERLVLRLGDTSDFALAFFGAVAAGVVPVPTSDQLTAEEVAFVAADCGAVALAVAPGLEVSTGLPVVGPEDLGRWRAGGARADWASTEADDPAFLVYTSGTTGRPKGVLHAHRSVLGRRPMYDGWLGIGPGDVVLHAGSFTWTYTLGVGLTDPWAVGATAVVHSGRRDPAAWPRLVEHCAATVFAAVPGVYRQLLARCAGGPLGAPDGPLRSLRHAVTAGEALAPVLLEEWRARTGLELFEALGMSEVSTFVSSGPSTPVRPGSPGRAQPGRRIAVLPVEGGEEPLPVGEAGLLAVHRSDPGLMLGYWQRPDEDGSAWRGDWFVSGDLVHVDADGYVHHHGRADDVMTSMGYRVSPHEVEAVLARHPSVGEVAVTEVAVRDGVRIITAFVVPAADEHPDEQVLLAFAAEHLARYKCPRAVRVVGRLPRTANGKVVRRSLARGPEPLS
ncbi:AMP-binding protein [Phycicoccus jejuensis]|uniref:class I adenylate-forming enzyme family protein n=1 Tax=Phycicoccus jejuensis TaxID=367299 RepID=UPI00384B4D76